MLAHAELDTYLHEFDCEKSKLSQILESFTYENFMTMKSNWLTHGRMLWYVYGNVGKE